MVVEASMLALHILPLLESALTSQSYLYLSAFTSFEMRHSVISTFPDISLPHSSSILLRMTVKFFVTKSSLYTGCGDWYSHHCEYRMQHDLLGLIRSNLLKHILKDPLNKPASVSSDCLYSFGIQGRIGVHGANVLIPNVSFFSQ